VLTASAYSNGDDVFLAWLLPRTEDCWGVAISRDLKRPSGETHSGFLENRTGFASDKPPPHSHRPSTEWPFQRYTWTDHGVGEGDTVSYRIVPMLKTADGLEPDVASAASVGPIKVTGGTRGPVHAFFNRGLLLSQFMAKRLGPDFTKADLVRLKSELAQNDDQLRAFLAGELGARLIQLLADAKAKKLHVYAALYELEDQALVDGLKAVGKRAHVVLSNGSKKKKGEDGNAGAAAQLDGVVDLHRRMLWSEGLGHNKFLVIAESEAKPLAVWTGSTNWATTGLCTQLNNAVLVEDPELATAYLQQWKLLRDDRRTGIGGKPMHFGELLCDANDEPKTTTNGSGKWTVWFTRTSAGQDIEAASELINKARHAILFLMFEPGNNGLLQVVQARLSPASPTFDPDLYVHGVVNTLRPAPAGAPEAVAVDLVGRGQNTRFDLRVVQPEGVRGGLPGWAAEVMRRDFLMGQGGVIGHAIIHSKVIVLDPFTKPVVITGSHNFSHPASAANDENLLIVRNKRLAERYAVNIMSNYQHYRWRAYLQQSAREGKSPWSGLTRSAAWQKKQPEHDGELQFWVR
jgi:phospholipase D-like protein